MPTPVLLPWDDEVNINGSSNKKRRVTTTTNAFVTNVRAEVVDGAIRSVERNNATMDTDANSSKKFSLTKDIGVRDMVAGGHGVYESSGRKIADAERKRNRDGEASSTVPSKENSFFARLDELKAYKVKYGHLRVSKKKDLPVQTLSSEEQRKASHVISHNLISTMPTPVLRPWDDENMTGSNNKKRRVRKIALTNETAGADGAIRLEERTNAMDAATKHSLPKSIGATEVAIVSISKPTEVDTIENEDHNVTVQQMDNLQENERIKPSKPKVDKKRDFFDRVDELKAYKDEHGHLNVRQKENQSLYNFCKNLRGTRRAIILGKGTLRKLTDVRIAALDAIGFDWEVGASSTVYKDFFSRVDELKAYKEKHGHLNVRPKDDKSLYNFCGHVRQARIGKGTYRLDDDRIAALDAIGFEWEYGTGASSEV